VNSDFFKLVAIIADVLTLASLAYAAVYGLMNKNRTLLGFNISKFISGGFKIGVIFFILALTSRLCFESIYLYSLLLFKSTSQNYYWEQGYELSHLAAYFIFLVIYLGIAWVIASTIWTGSFNQAKLFFNWFLPVKLRVSVEKFTPLMIVSAKYGANNSFLDLTEKLKKMIEGNSLTITASNDISGDPILGVPKELIVEYRYYGEEIKSISIKEGQTKTINPS
jgi:hypothetical protein